MEIVTTQQQAAAAAASGASGTGGSGMANGAQLETRSSFIVAANGAIEEGPGIDVLPSGAGDASDTGDAAGEQTIVAYEGAAGNVLATAQAQVRSISRTGSRIVIAPRAPVGATHARLAGMGVSRLSSRALSR
jgi:hypothetical protein